MITLITGSPGTGKTALVVSMLQDFKDREIWVSGIPELTTSHIELSSPEKWYEVVPDSALIVIDEVQRVWRPRAAGTRVPDHVAALETHRHRGIDFIILTQGPNLLDSNVRSLVGRHIHLRDLGVLGRRWYEWPECSDNVRTSWKNAPIRKSYRLPNSVFNQYRSSSFHYKPNRSFPVPLAIAAGAVVFSAFLGWRVYSNIANKADGGITDISDTENFSQISNNNQIVPVSSGVSHHLPDERVDFIPRISDRPWTAPAYDELRFVVRMPIISGAICVNDDCKCYAVGGGYLPDVDSKACRDWVINRPFNPYFNGNGNINHLQQVQQSNYAHLDHLEH